MIFDPILDFFRGKAITIPALDGAFRANNLLEEAAVFAKLSGADNLAVLDNRVIAGSGKILYTFDEEGNATKLQSYPAEITAIAVSSKDELVIGLENGDLLIGGRQA